MNNFLLVFARGIDNNFERCFSGGEQAAMLFFPIKKTKKYVIFPIRDCCLYRSRGVCHC
jgi:hypothetical protein